MDLNAPLGMSPPPKPPRRRGLALAIVGGVAAVSGLAALGVLLVTADPHGGEPYVVASIAPAAPKPQPAVPPAAPLDTSATASLPPGAPPPAFYAGNGAAGASGIRAAAPAASTPLIIDVAKALADRQHVSLASPARPALPSPALAPPTPEPSVAIFISGMGLSQSATRTAIEIMPAAVTLAFVPYGETVAASVAAAKAKGHEILLQVPMQNAAGAAPGPHTLQPGEAAANVGEDVAWLMGRFSGYDGVVNLLGAPVTADRTAMTALLKTVAAHGLFYLDDGTSHRSLGRALTLEQGLASGRADVVLDATADPAVVRANLETLIAIARSKGSAIGMASGLPDHLATIAAFASGLAARNVKLVPVGALITHAAAVAVAQ